MTIRRATVADAAAIARVHVDSWRFTYRGLVPQPYLDSLSYADREARWRVGLGRDDAAGFVAVEARAVVGFAHAGARRSDGLDSDGELYAIYLLGTHFRRGLGRRLFDAARTELIARGYATLGLWVLRDNSACHFYEAIGGVRVATGEHFVGGACLDKVGYLWRLDAAEPRPVGRG
jgi:ribosomal protein S18 acetylase RimI-like enzyme